MKKLTKKAGFLAALMLMFGTATFAQERENVGNTDLEEFNQYDVNTDRQLDQDEFTSRMEETQAYENWQNEEGTLTEEDFNRGTFERWDANNDSYLDADEYTTGNSVWETDYGNNFDTWDRNRDSRLDVDEYNNGMTEAGIYSDWDANSDGNLDQDEFNQGTFNRLDMNRDGRIDDSEYNQSDIGTWSGTGQNIETGIDNDYK